MMDTRRAGPNGPTTQPGGTEARKPLAFGIRPAQLRQAIVDALTAGVEDESDTSEKKFEPGERIALPPAD